MKDWQRFGLLMLFMVPFVSLFKNGDLTDKILSPMIYAIGGYLLLYGKDKEMSHPFDKPQSGGLIPWYFNPAIWTIIITFIIIITTRVIWEIFK